MDTGLLKKKKKFAKGGKRINVIGVSYGVRKRLSLYCSANNFYVYQFADMAITEALDKVGASKESLDESEG